MVSLSIILTSFDCSVRSIRHGKICASTTAFHVSNHLQIKQDSNIELGSEKDIVNGKAALQYSVLSIFVQDIGYKECAIWVGLRTAGSRTDCRIIWLSLRESFYAHLTGLSKSVPGSNSRRVFECLL